MDYVAGYVIFNDITARDIQRREMRSGVFSFCKAIDTFCPLGPWIVTADEVPDPADLTMRLRVNGETRQDSHSRNMSTTIPEILSHYSALGYSAGDVLSTGTVVGRRGLQRRRGVAVPATRRRDRGGDRAHRHPAEPCRLVAGRPRRAGARARSLVSWPRDDAKLERVRTLMAEHDLDALVVRAPDNVLYLTNFWGMKGYDACVFPREGEPVLICLEASEEDARRTSWTSDLRFVRGYAEDDPRPVPARTLDAALAAAREHGNVGLELTMGTQATDRMVGEPTTFTKGWFDAWPLRATRCRSSTRLVR